MAQRLRPKRIFVSQVDTYQGFNISKYLAFCVVGASQEDADEEEEDGGSIKSGVLTPCPKDGCYNIFGSLKDGSQKKPDFVKEIIDNKSREDLYEHVVECDIIVYDISKDPELIDEAVWVVSRLRADAERLDSPKTFILISSLMTWEKTKPNLEDPDAVFTEDDSRQRKSHPNYKEHLSAEKTVLKMGKGTRGRLNCYVVATGLTYGEGEDIFHFLFKSAWHNAEELIVYGNGQNILPTIHVRDLAGVIQNIADARPKQKYLVAVDDSQNTLEDIVKTISEALTTGRVQQIGKDEAMANKNINQADFDLLMLNLRIEAAYVKENMRISWVAELGIKESIETVVTEYRNTRNLKPFRLCILGPPASGKTTIAQQIAKAYKLHHLRIKEVIADGMENLEKVAARIGVSADDEGNEQRFEQAAELMENINESKAEFNGRIGTQYIERFYKEKLASHFCQNQGYVMDGYPKTRDQADNMFMNEDEEEPNEKLPSYNPLITPQYVIVLDASNDFLFDRIRNLPESTVSGTHNTEEGLRRRLEEYRNANTDEFTVLNYFDEREIHPYHFNAEKTDVAMYEDIVENIKKMMGQPRNYGPTPREQQQMEKAAEQKKLEQQTREREQKQKEEADGAAERKFELEQWSSRLDEIKRQEYEMLEAKALPTRHYLMDHVMPTLTQALIDTAKVRPEDPIDYVAEYLFRHTDMS